jgi:hypothetical protein
MLNCKNCLRLVISGISGLNRMSWSIASLRLAKTWDEFNDFRLMKDRKPENILLQGIIGDSRLAALKELFNGIIDVAFFGICFLQGCYTLGIYAPVNFTPIVDTIAWTGALFTVYTSFSAYSYYAAYSKKSLIHRIKRKFSSVNNRPATEVLRIFETAGFFTGPHEGLLLLCPSFEPVINPNRQVSYELKLIRSEFENLCSCTEAEIFERCEAAEEQCDTQIALFQMDCATKLLISFVAIIGIPFNHYYAAASMRWFGSFSNNMVHVCEVIRMFFVILDCLFAYFVMEPAFNTLRQDRLRKFKTS